MKTFEDYVAPPYRVETVEDKGEGGSIVSSLGLPDCITCEQTAETAVSNARNVKRAWVVAALEDGVEIPEPDSLEDHFGQFKLRIPRSLHHVLT